MFSLVLYPTLMSHPRGASNAECSFSAEGVMRTMTTEKLLKGMPVLQTQIDTLLEFDVSQTLAWLYRSRHKTFCWALLGCFCYLAVLSI